MSRKASIRIGFLGFGEAGSEIAAGLKDEGLQNVVAHDVNWNTPPFGALIRERAQRVGVSLVTSPAELAEAADLVFSLVVSKAALEAAASIAPHLRLGQWYVDFNSISPAAKQKVGEVVEAAGGRFVDVAVTAPVPGNRHKAPMLCAGAHARELAELLRPWNMKLEYVGEKPGQAAAIKMFRSIVVKGFEALLVESLVASYPYGAHETVVKSIQESFSHLNWETIVAHLLPRHAIHAERRAHEMLEVMDCLKEIGMEPIMSEATYRRLHWSARFKLKEHYGGKLPSDWRDVIGELHRRRAEAET